MVISGKKYNDGITFMMATLFRNAGLAAAVLVWFLIPAQAHAASCGTSVSSLHGWYGMLVTGGSLLNDTAKYQVGAVLFNGAGTVSASHVYGSGGTPSAATGTYVQNTDCTLTITLTVGSAQPAVFTVAVKNTGEAVGIEVDSSAVANVSFKPQYAAYTSGLYFSASALNGTFTSSCSGPLSASSDLNLGTFFNGALSGTDPYNNGGSFATANVPYSGTYTVNTDGTFAGSLTVLGTPFDYYGVIGTANTEIEYLYVNVSNGSAADAFAACVGGVAAAPSTPVNLAPNYNADVFFTDGTAPTAGGFDGSDDAYSAKLLGSSVIWAGSVFTLGPANGPDAVSNATVTLPAGSYSTLNLLAASSFGPQTGTFVVTYTDGTKATFTQSLSDWGAPGHITGESIAVAMPYRLNTSGAQSTGPWYLYGYSFALNNTKKVASLMLPASTNIRTLSAVLLP